MKLRQRDPKQLIDDDEDDDDLGSLTLSLIGGCQCQHENQCSTKTLHGPSNRVTANDQLTQSLTPCVRGTCSWATLTQRKAAV